MSFFFLGVAVGIAIGYFMHAHFCINDPDGKLILSTKGDKTIYTFQINDLDELDKIENSEIIFLKVERAKNTALYENESSKN